MADEQPGPAPEPCPAPPPGPAPLTEPAAELPSAAAEGNQAPEPVPGAAADDPIYVSKREVRKNAGKGTSKKSMYFLEFYLVDNHGYETLAATGEDQGVHHTEQRRTANAFLYGVVVPSIAASLGYVPSAPMKTICWP